MKDGFSEAEAKEYAKLLLSATDSAAVVKATAGFLDNIVKRMDELQKAIDNANSLFNQFPTVGNKGTLTKAEKALTDYKNETSAFQSFINEPQEEGGVSMTYKDFGLFPNIRVAFVNWQPNAIFTQQTWFGVPNGSAVVHGGYVSIDDTLRNGGVGIGINVNRLKTNPTPTPKPTPVLATPQRPVPGIPTLEENHLSQQLISTVYENVNTKDSCADFTFSVAYNETNGSGVHHSMASHAGWTDTILATPQQV